MPDRIKLYESESASAYIIGSDILHITLFAEASFSGKESHAISKAAFDHFKGKYKVLTVPQEFAVIESEVRNFLVTPERKDRVIADAIVITNLPHRLLADFYLKVQRPEIPTRLFDSFDEALAWLHSLG